MTTPLPAPPSRGLSWGLVLLLILGGVALGCGAYVLLQHGVFSPRPALTTTVSEPVKTPPTQVFEPAPPVVEPVTGKTYSAVVAMGLEQFMALYQKKAKDESEAGQDHAAMAYEKIKQADNDEKATALTESQRQQVAGARDLLKTISSASCEAEMARNGGGTMYAHMSTREGAAIEDDLGKLIDVLSRNGADAQARAEAKSQMKAIHAELQVMQAYVPGPDENYVHFNGYQAAVKTLSGAVTKLDPLVAGLPDRAAGALARFANDYLFSMDGEGK